MSIFRLKLYLQPLVIRDDISSFIEVMIPDDQDMLVEHFEIMMKI